jgi:hypothetical protein
MKTIVTSVLVLVTSVSWAADITRYAKPIPSTYGVFYHNFDVATYDDGRQEVYRGGPGSDEGGFATSPDASLVSSAEALIGVDLGVSGNVLASVRPFDATRPDFANRDANGTVISFYTQWPSRVIAYGSDAEIAGYMTIYKNVAEAINTFGAKYNPANNNSNTTIYIGALAAGLNTSVPYLPIDETLAYLGQGLFTERFAPGWGHPMYKEAGIIGGLQGVSFDGTRFIPAAPDALSPPPGAPGTPQRIGYEYCLFSCKTFYDLTAAQISALQQLAVLQGGSLSLVSPLPAPLFPVPIFEPPPGIVEIGPLIPIDPPFEIIGPSPFSEIIGSGPYSGGGGFGGGFGFSPFAFSASTPPLISNPEPSTWLLMLTGLLLLVWRYRAALNRKETI